MDMKRAEVELDLFFKTNEEYKSVAYDCNKINDSRKCFSGWLEWLVKPIVDNKHKTFIYLTK